MTVFNEMPTYYNEYANSVTLNNQGITVLQKGTKLSLLAKQRQLKITWKVTQNSKKE